MSTLLLIDSSARTERSRTRHLTERFATGWRERRPLDTVIRRDVGVHPPAPVDAAWIAAAFTPAEQRTTDQHAALRLSETLVQELLDADVIVLGAPMYNFGMPAQLKAYIDQVVRVNRTFAFDPNDREHPYRPLVPAGKRMVLITATGDAGYEPGGPLAHLNHLEPHLQTVFGFIGVSDIRVVRVAYDEFPDERIDRSVQAAERALEELLREWAGEPAAAGAGRAAAMPA